MPLPADLGGSATADSHNAVTAATRKEIAFCIASELQEILRDVRVNLDAKQLKDCARALADRLSADFVMRKRM